jgi:NAD(P)-dependent dehydrogenase (short-subunit alcohol dehydrogenase family)
MSHGRFDNPLVAALPGFFDLFRAQPLRERFGPGIRFDQRRVLITGANSGLGFAAAVEIARRGGRVTMACRSEIPQAGERARKQSGVSTIDMRRCDLADLDSIYEFVDGLVRDDRQFDVVILNAAVTLPRSRQTASGQDEMFLVNYLANVILSNLLLGHECLSHDHGEPRLLFISSDSHRGASAIDFDEFGHYFDYGVNKAIANYSYFKLLLNTYATELDRRINGKKAGSRTQINLICPGPVNSNIIKAAPWPLRFILRAIFTVIFKSPANAAEPLIYLSGSDDFNNRSNEYLHMFSLKPMDDKVYDQVAGKRLWDESMKVWGQIDARAAPLNHS